MAVIKRKRKLKNGKTKISWQAEVLVDGVKIKTKTFPTKGAAYTWHDEYKKKAEESGVYFEKECDYTFKGAWGVFLKEHVAKLAVSSQEEYEFRQKYFITSPIANIKMNCFHPRHLDAWIAWILKHKTSRSEQRKSFLRELKLLQAFFNWYQDNWDHKFPKVILKRHRQDAKYKVTKSRRPDYFLKPQEVIRWLRVLEDDAPVVYLQFAICMLHTGLRVGEAAGICWDSIDFKANTISIRRSVCWPKTSGMKPFLKPNVKNKSSVRLLYMTAEVVAVLKAIKKKSMAIAGPVFKQASGDLLHSKSIRSHFDKAFVKVGLEYRGTHIIRHTYASLALKGTDGNISAVQSALGHRSRATTELYAKANAIGHKGVGESVVKLLESYSE